MKARSATRAVLAAVGTGASLADALAAAAAGTDDEGLKARLRGASLELRASRQEEQVPGILRHVGLEPPALALLLGRGPTEVQRDVATTALAAVAGPPARPSRLWAASLLTAAAALIISRVTHHYLDHGGLPALGEGSGTAAEVLAGLALAAALASLVRSPQQLFAVLLRSAERRPVLLHLDEGRLLEWLAASAQAQVPPLALLRALREARLRARHRSLLERAVAATGERGHVETLRAWTEGLLSPALASALTAPPPGDRPEETARRGARAFALLVPRRDDLEPLELLSLALSAAAALVLTVRIVGWVMELGRMIS